MPIRYDALSRALHWLMALLIVALFAGAIIRDEMPRGDARNLMLVLHIFGGVLFLGLAVLRGSWLLARARVQDFVMARWMALSSRAVHGLLYVLMLMVPLAGLWLYGVRGRPSTFFGVTMPSLFESNDGVRKLASETHELLAYALVGLAVIHAAAALYHHFVLKDGLLARMFPRWQPRS